MKQIFYGLVISAFVFVVACKNETSKQTEATKLVKVERVSDGISPDDLVFNGKIKERSLTTLSFRVGGPLVDLNVSSGDYVNSGDIIAKIDQRDYKIKLQADEAKYIQIKGEYERYKELFEKNKLPANTFEKIKSGYLMSKAASDNSKNQLEDTELKTPVSGYVYEKHVEKHQTVGAGNPIVSIIDLSVLEVIVAVPESQIQKIKQCKTGYLDVKNAQVCNMPVSLVSIGEKTRKDGLYEVKFSFVNKNDLQILPGMSAKIKLRLNDQQKEAKYIATSAIFSQSNKTYVWKYNSATNKINKKQVVVKNIVSDGKVEVLSGLQKDELIVVAGVHNLSEGQNVKLIQTPSRTNIGGLL
ncbi:MAG: efflux RND transporter periplasmic adaptor subunit [Bacteroidales bacterium]|nr:efflux RND transporter periplasmic adaptor subunit [Bacteroidales bacterium]